MTMFLKFCIDMQATAGDIAEPNVYAVSSLNANTADLRQSEHDPIGFFEDSGVRCVNSVSLCNSR